MRILLDTNVLLRSAEPLHTRYGAASGATHALREQGHQIILIPQVLYEFWAVATRPLSGNGLGWTAEAALKEIIKLQDLFLLLRDERMVYSIWQQLAAAHRVLGKQTHDARIAAAMQRHGVTHLLTFNGADFTRFPAVQVISPPEVVAGLSVE